MQLPDFSKANVLVVGDLMLDRYWSGPAGRISHEAPVPVVKISEIEDRPGGAANVALNAATLGAKVTLLGISGDDESADVLQHKLSALGVICDFVKLSELDTITKLRVLSRNQQLIRLDFEQDYSGVDKSQLTSHYEQHLASADMVILSDYDKGALSHADELITLAREKSVPVIVDPKGDFQKFKGATLLTPNMAVFEHIVGHCEDEFSFVERAQKLSEELQLDALLVTRSEQGMTLLQANQSEFHLPAKAKEVYDVTGADDTVISTLAVAVAAGAEWRHAAILANAAASIVVGQLGTSAVTPSELRDAVAGSTEQSQGVMTEAQLKIAMNAAKAAGQKIVMTIGCFDILHDGHVSYLEHVSKLGDKLIVAVNADESVKRLKGRGRPINNLQRRMAVLAGLPSVDWVVPFSEDTPERLITYLLPDLLIKGGDYKVEDIAGGRQVIANGGEVQLLKFEDGVSTNGINEAIVERQKN